MIEPASLRIRRFSVSQVVRGRIITVLQSFPFKFTERLIIPALCRGASRIVFLTAAYLIIAAFQPTAS
jgi:hypothetical protein